MNNDVNNRLKNFLVYGIQSPTREEPEERTEETVEAGEEEIDPVEERIDEPAAQEAGDDTLKSIEAELISIRYTLEDLRDRSPETDLTPYLTSREQSKALNATFSKVESSIGNKALVRAMEQVCTMREDFLRLCKGMRPRIAEMDPETVLSSFEAYCVDMENILTDGGVYVGRFDYDRLNTLHQRIVGVVPTGEKEKDGTIAERQSDGYKLGEKVLLKERVTVYKYDPSSGTPDAPEEETASETDSETPYESGGAAKSGPGSTEEKE